MNIDVDEFMRKSTSAYNFQYINLSDLDRIIRNVQRKPDRSSPPPTEARSDSVRLISDDEINEILRSAEQDLEDNQAAVEECVPVPRELATDPPVESDSDSSSDGASTICSSPVSSLVFSSVQDLTRGVSDEVADIEDNLIGEDEYGFDDFLVFSSGSQENSRKQSAGTADGAVEPCVEYLDSESIVEEIIFPPDDNDGDSESSVNAVPVVFRVKSPVKPASKLIKTYEQECKNPINEIQPILDFAAIERASKSSSRGSGLPMVRSSISSVRMRPPSRKSLVEEFDTFIKITELQKKVCMLIDEVRLCLGKVEEPEDELEKKKREKRTAEFLIRFQRNYLYQMNRLEEDICVMSKGSPEIAKKVYQLYRIIGQALKFYLKNMKYFIINVSPEKLWTLVKQILSSTKMCAQKTIFDEDDLIVAEINEKCHLLRHRLKEEVSKAKNKLQRSKRTKKPSAVSPTPVQSSKLSMYGVTSSVQQKRRVQTQRSAITASRKPVNSKPQAAKRAPVKKPPRGRIIAVPMVKSSCSLFGRTSESAPRLLTPAKTMDDVVTAIQQQNDPLANSRLLKEVSSALTKMSTSRDAAISPEINQQLHQLIMETIQNITQQQLKQLIPSLECPAAKTTATIPSKTAQSVDGETCSATAAAVATTDVAGEKSSVAAEVTGATDQTARVEKCFSNSAASQQQQQVQRSQVSPLVEKAGKLRGRRQQRKTRDDSGENEDDDDDDGEDCEGVEAKPNRRRSGRDCVGDSQSSDSGKTPAKITADGVDWEITGVRTGADPKCGRPVGVRTGKQRSDGSLLEERKRSSQPHRQQKINFSHNLQYLEIVSPQDDQLPKPVPEVECHLNLAQEVANRERQQRRREFYAQLKKQVVRDRRQTIQRMASNPVYVNANFERPWQTVSDISDQLVEELVRDTTDELDFGERSFVEEFLRLQLGG